MKKKLVFQLISRFSNYRVTVGKVDYVVSKEYTEQGLNEGTTISREDGKKVSISDKLYDRILEAFEKQDNIR